MSYFDKSAGQDKTAAEFFAGIGLMRMGLERQGWSVEFANDIDPLKHKMYSDQFGLSPDFVLGDIHKLTADEVPTVTLATASFPCTDLSLAGARLGLSGKQSSAFWGFVDVIRALENRKPPLLLIENVPGFLTSHNGHDFLEAMLALNKLGYLVDAFVIDASNFVPQSRQRLFVLAKHEAVFGLASTKASIAEMVSNIRPRQLVEFMLKHTEICWSVRPLPSLASKALDLDTILEDLPHDHHDWWSTERAAYLLNQMSVSHRALAERMISDEKWSYGTVFRRVRNKKSMAELRFDGIAGCLRTPKGGSGRQILFKAGYGRYHVRLLSPQECARLMGADGFKITVPLNQALFGFGDAVCVPVIEWITREYLSPLLLEAASPKSDLLEVAYA